jgi:hypothetical protein
LLLVRPSSFVFVAIVALWAAHLLPQWIRRRDALGASRGDDRHSSALRVLVRRAQRHASGRSSAPLLPSIPVVSEPVVAAPAPGPASPLVLPGRTAPAAELAARRRRSVLAGLTGLTLLSIVGAAAGAVPAGLAVVCTLLLALDVAALRTVAVAERRRRAARAERARRAAVRAERAARAAAAPRVPVAPPVPVEQPAAPAPAPEAPDADQQVAALTAEPAVADDHTWVPVPVPPPTYTLKPVAHRREPAPLELELAPAAPYEPAPAASREAEPAAEVDLDSVLERRRAVNG